MAAVMRREFVKFRPDEKAQDAAQAFERYDLVSAPVVDGDGKLIGRVTVDAVMDYIREETDSDMLSAGGAARGRGPVRLGLEQRQEPLDLARDQPGDRVHRLARDRALRAFDRASWWRSRR